MGGLVDGLEAAAAAQARDALHDELVRRERPRLVEGGNAHLAREGDAEGLRAEDASKYQPVIDKEE